MYKTMTMMMAARHTTPRRTPRAIRTLLYDVTESRSSELRPEALGEIEGSWIESTSIDISDATSYSSMDFRCHFKHPMLQDLFWNDFIVTPYGQPHIHEGCSLQCYGVSLENEDFLGFKTGGAFSVAFLFLYH